MATDAPAAVTLSDESRSMDAELRLSRERGMVDRLTTSAGGVPFSMPEDAAKMPADAKGDPFATGLQPATAGMPAAAMPPPMAGPVPPQPGEPTSGPVATYFAPSRRTGLVAMADGENLKMSLTSDGVLPNAAGYGIMAPLAERAIAEVLQK